MTFFQTYPQRRAQWGRVRRGGHTDSGVVVVHTYEAPAGRTWQAGADWLLRRTDPGSYHWLADALGGHGHLAPWSAETWHCRHTNPWSVGVSMMTYASTWRSLTTTQRDNLVRGAALGAARYSAWRVSTGRAPVPARRITRAQAMARVPGFIGHGETDPGRRFDPGAGFPWAQFLAEYQRLLTATTTTREVLSMSDIETILRELSTIKTALARVDTYAARGDADKAKAGVGRLEAGQSAVQIAGPPLPIQVWGHNHPADPSTDMGGYVVSTYRRLVELTATVGTLADALAAAERGQGGTLTTEQIRTAAETGARDGAADILGRVRIDIDQED